MSDAAVIVLAIALLVETIILTVGASRYVDLIERYLAEADGRRRATADLEAAQTQKAAAEDRIARLEKAFFETTGSFSTVANLDGLGASDIRDMVNGVVHENEDDRDSSSDPGRSSETVPNHVATGKPGESSRGLPR